MWHFPQGTEGMWPVGKQTGACSGSEALCSWPAGEVLQGPTGGNLDFIGVFSLLTAFLSQVAPASKGEIFYCLSSYLRDGGGQCQLGPMVWSAHQVDEGWLLSVKKNVNSLRAGPLASCFHTWGWHSVKFA